jgi:hypothetical protein
MEACVINFTANLLSEQVPGGTMVNYNNRQSEQHASRPLLYTNFSLATLYRAYTK